MAGAGAASADVLYASVAVLAGASIVTIIEPVSQEIRLFSALILLGLAGVGLRNGLKVSKDNGKTAKSCGSVRMFVQFLGLTIVNPLTVLYFGALILGRDSSSPVDFSDQIAFVIGAGMASLSWQTLLAGIGGIARKHLPENFQKVAIIVGNLIILVLGLRILWIVFS